MYCFNSRVRFSETDENKRLSLTGIIDYFQDCSTFQTEELGVGFSYLEPKGLTWVLTYWQIVIEEYPTLGEEITVGTLPYDFKSFMGKRNFFMEKEGRKVAKADSLWILLELKNLRPMKIPQELLDTYKKEEKLEMDYAPRKITVEGEEKQQEPVTIQRHHLDCNLHVNNGQYIKITSAYLPEDFKVRQLRAEYKNQAHLGDILYPCCYIGEDTYTVVLYDEYRQPYVVVEYK